MAEVTARDCQACGACCVSDVPSSSRYVQLIAEDIERLPASYLLHHVVPPRLHDHWSYEGLAVDKNHPDGPACVAFRGRAGDNCKCDIHEHRPRVCREFEPGSDKCLEVRSEFFEAHGSPIVRGGKRATRPFEWRTG